MSESINPERIPAELRACDRWICWTRGNRDGKQTKRPIHPETNTLTSVTDPASWCAFETAYETATSRGNGIGFVFTDDDAIVGVDLDDCRDPETGRPTTWAKEIIQTLGSYTGVSLPAVSPSNLSLGE